MSCNNLIFPYEPSLGTSGGGGGATTLSNVGGGTVTLVNALSGGNYPIKSFEAGSGITLVESADKITVNATGSIADGTVTESTLRWNGTAWVQNANIKSYSDGKLRITGVTTGGTLGIIQVSGTDPFTITAGSTTRYMSLIDNVSGQSEYQINKGGSTYQKGTATIDNNNGLELAELDANGSGRITIKSNSNMGSANYTVFMPAVQGAVDTYLKNDGSGNLTWGAVGGLDYWTESEWSYGAATGTKFTPSSANTNQSITLQPKGNGSITAQQPDGTTAGGNKRGSCAVDFQMERDSATQVAGGANSAIITGLRNQVTGHHSIIASGSYNVISGPYSGIFSGSSNSISPQQCFIGGGYVNTITSTGFGRNAIAGGERNNISGLGKAHSFIGSGYFNVLSASHSGIVGGYFNEVNADYSAIVGGNSCYIGTGTSSFVGGGEANSINGTGAWSAIVGGRSNSMDSTIFGYNTIGGGWANSIQNAEKSTILGGANNRILALSHGSTIIGNDCIAEAGGQYSTVMGRYGRSSRYGERAYANGTLQSVRDNGFSDIVLLAKTTSATPQEIFIGNVANERIKIQYNSTTLIKYRWVRRKLSDNTVTVMPEQFVIVDKGATHASTTIISQFPAVPVYEGNDGSFVSAADTIVVSADTTNGTAKFTATGKAGTDILWFVYAQIIEIIE